MAKGVIYVMTSAVPGLIKIGKTGTANFEQRMYNLENNGFGICRKDNREMEHFA